MITAAYADRTSVVCGGTLRFSLPPHPVPVSVCDVATGQQVFRSTACGPEWTVRAEWPSSLYRASFGTTGADASQPYFVVRPAEPGATSAILVSVPFPTWEAYNHLGVPGHGLYLTEQPDRAVRVRFDRPGGGAENAGGWELGFYRWLAASGRRVEYCSGLDLHSGAAGLNHYRLLVCAGHDEYWSWEMRERVQEYLDAGGNLAFFTGNTCWWQVRFEDDLRSMVCYRDAVRDPMAARDPSRTTTEWSSAPVDRPENSLTGVSFRRGAGCWADMTQTDTAGYTARFAQHWVFGGTGLRDGDRFAVGAVGYETDAADFEEIDGVPRVTGRDGTPPDFVVLATADLRHWRRFGQGGHATMGIFRRGRGTVFNAATVNWSNRLGDPVLARITANVLDRLSGPRGRPEWEDIGGADAVRAIAACENRLFGGTSTGTLMTRDICAQNLAWRTVETAPGLLALAAPRELTAGRPVGLYGLFADGVVAERAPLTQPARWAAWCRAPAGTVDIAVSFQSLFAATERDGLWSRPLAVGAAPDLWRRVGNSPRLRALTSQTGRLFGVTADHRICSRAANPEGGMGEAEWVDGGPAPATAALAGHAGWLIAAGADGRLRRRAAGGQ